MRTRILSSLACLMLVLAGATASSAAPRYDFARYLNIRAAWAPVVSPDGREIAFLSNAAGIPQVWRIPLHGGRLEQVTRDDDRVSTVRWAPNGRSLVFARDAKGNERTQLYLSNARGSETLPLTADPKAIFTLGGYSDDGNFLAFASNQRNAACFDIYIRDMTNHKVRNVLQEDGTWRVEAWKPDNAALVVSETTSNMNNDLYLLELVGGHRRLLTRHSGDVLYGNVCWPAGSDWIYVTTNRDREFEGLARIHVQNGRMEPLGPAQWDVSDLCVSHDGKWMAWITDEDGYSRLRVASLDRVVAAGRGEPPAEWDSRTYPELRGIASGLSISRDGGSLVVAWSGARHPSDVWALDLGKLGAPWQVTHSSLNGIAPSSFVEPRLVHYPSFDGKKIPALLYVPLARDAGGKLPVVLSIHGGPESQERPGFSPVYQYLLQRGYAVLAPNIRGSTGYGRAYTHLDDGRKRGDAINDVAWAVQYLGTVAGVDAKRVAIMGGSYGGYMTLAALVFHPDLFAAGVDIVGIANFETFLANTGPWRRRLRISEYGDPVKDLDFLRKVSPINHVDDIEAPLMVIHGAQDPRVPISEAEQIVKSLQIRGKPVEFLRFEDEGHGLVRLKNRIRAYTAIGEFLDRYLKPTQK